VLPSVFCTAAFFAGRPFWRRSISEKNDAFPAMKHLILCCFLLFAATVSAQDNEKACLLWAKVADVIQREHYRPKPIDDSLSVFVFDQFIDLLDQDRNLLTKPEYQSLRLYRNALDDALLSGNCAFLDGIAATYKIALERKRAILGMIGRSNLDYSGRDTLHFSRESFPFDLEENQLEHVWRKRLAFETLEEVAKHGNDLDSLKADFTALEKQAFGKVIDNELCKIDNILQSPTGFYTDLQHDFLDVYCSYFDPHTNYFFDDARTSFLSALSTSSLSFGLDLGVNDDNEITVEGVVPGGPAAETKKFEKDDVIIKVTGSDGREYMVSCTGLDGIGAMIYSDQNKKIKFTLRKKNGALLDVPLKKQLMKDAGNSVYSCIAENKFRAGYIRIPEFYTDFDGHSGRGVAADVADEIGKLEKERVDGIVLDLQDNGGGSMDEAVRLAGMFIGKAPVAISRDRYDNLNILRDNDARQLYEGPIVVLINGNSASATEFFTAAIQDYRRGIVAGATSLGKASIQVILPADGREREFVKTTIQKFYRVTGESGQRKGIVPDIYFPTLYDSLTVREKDEKQALRYDSIPKRVAFSRLDVDFTKIVAESRGRIAGSERFAAIAALDKRINALYGENVPPVPLTLEAVFRKVKEVDRIWKQIRDETEKPTPLKATMTAFEAKRAKRDKLVRETDEDRLKAVVSSPAIEEAVNIIGGLKTLR
jgi:carboxyl-terminal processing protease